MGGGGGGGGGALAHFLANDPLVKLEWAIIGQITGCGSVFFFI